MNSISPVNNCCECTLLIESDPDEHDQFLFSPLDTVLREKTEARKVEETKTIVEIRPFLQTFTHHVGLNHKLDNPTQEVTQKRKTCIYKYI